MKKILTLITLAAGLLFAVESQAQLNPVVGGIIYSNAATTNFASPLVIDCTAQKDIALALTFKLSGAGTEVSSFHFKRSLDAAGTYAEGTPAYVFQKAGNGATGATIATNITVAGFPYLIMVLGSNATAGADITNITVRSWVKPNAP